MPNILLAKQMLDALKRDFHDAWDKKQSLEDIHTDAYCKKFGVSEEDIEAYCATLTPMTLVHPVCVICGEEWGYGDKIIKPVNNGHILNWVDHVDAFCVGEEGMIKHDAIWYYQDKDGRSTFEMEIDDLHGRDYGIRWNCHCMEEECYGKTVIVDYGPDREDYTILRYCDDLPYSITREEVYDLIKNRLIFK